MNKQDIPTLTELIDSAQGLIDAIETPFERQSAERALMSIAYSQIAISRSLSRQTGIMEAMLGALSELREKP